MESSTSNYSVKTFDERKFEKIFKDSIVDKVHGRVYKYSTYSNPNSQNVTAERFQIYRPSTDWNYTYAFYDFHEPFATDLFPEIGEYSTLKTETFTNTHFCGSVFTFPQTFSYSTNCSTSNFISSEPNTVHGTFNSYQHIKGTNFDPVMNTGYFPVSWP